MAVPVLRISSFSFYEMRSIVQKKYWEKVRHKVDVSEKYTGGSVEMDPFWQVTF